MTVTTDNQSVVSACRVLFIAVKPHIVSVALKEMGHMITANHLVISIAAGISLETLCKVPACSLLFHIIHAKQTVGVSLSHEILKFEI